jgi:hypothetical protein
MTSTWQLASGCTAATPHACADISVTDRISFGRPRRSGSPPRRPARRTRLLVRLRCCPRSRTVGPGSDTAFDAEYSKPRGGRRADLRVECRLSRSSPRNGRPPEWLPDRLPASARTDGFPSRCFSAPGDRRMAEVHFGVTLSRRGKLVQPSVILARVVDDRSDLLGRRETRRRS